MITKMPVIYTEAVKALVSCQTLDEAKYFASQAEALAAWARMFHKDEAGVEAKRLKLHAYRRLGELARELRPGGVASKSNPAPDGRRGRWGPNRFAGKLPGPSSILKENGLNKCESQSALKLSRMAAEQFHALANLPRPPSPTTIGTTRQGVSREFELFTTSFMSARSFTRKRKSADFVQEVPPADAPKIRALCVEVIEWLDDLERRLPPDGDAPKDSRRRGDHAIRAVPIYLSP